METDKFEFGPLSLLGKPLFCRFQFTDVLPQWIWRDVERVISLRWVTKGGLTYFLRMGDPIVDDYMAIYEYPVIIESVAPLLPDERPFPDWANRKNIEPEQSPPVIMVTCTKEAKDQLRVDVACIMEFGEGVFHKIVRVLRETGGKERQIEELEVWLDTVSSRFSGAYTAYRIAMDAGLMEEELAAISETPVTNKGFAPWEQIPDKAWDREALRLFYEGLSTPDISKRLNITSSRISNRLTELRKDYPEIVPTRDVLRKMKRQEGW